eukprot:scaffold4998_cov120-Isochrysis_galbana.AAC.7
MGSVQCAIYIPNCNARTNSRGKSPHAIPALTGMRYYRYRCSAHMRTRRISIYISRSDLGYRPPTTSPSPFVEMCFLVSPSPSPLWTLVSLSCTSCFIFR